MKLAKTVDNGRIALTSFSFVCPKDGQPVLLQVCGVRKEQSSVGAGGKRKVRWVDAQEDERDGQDPSSKVE